MPAVSSKPYVETLGPSIFDSKEDRRRRRMKQLKKRFGVLKKKNHKLKKFAKEAMKFTKGSRELIEGSTVDDDLYYLLHPPSEDEEEYYGRAGRDTTALDEVFGPKPLPDEEGFTKNRWDEKIRRLGAAYKAVSEQDGASEEEDSEQDGASEED